MLTGSEPSLSEGWENFSGCKANVLLRRSALKRPDGAMVFWKVKYDWSCLLYASFLFLLCVPVAPFPFFPTSNLSVSLFSSSSVCVAFWGATMIMALATHYRRKAMMSFVDHRSHAETS